VGYWIRETALETLQQTGQLSARDAGALLSREDVLEAIQVGAAGLFVGFLFENPDILGDQDLVRWI
jgi:hypothetical protein